jgi:uncharacterized protein YkwD
MGSWPDVLAQAQAIKNECRGDDKPPMPSKNRLRFLAVAATLAAALLVPSHALASGCAHADQNPNDMSVADAEHATLCLLNNERRQHGIRPFKDNSRLDLASRRHARDMSRRNYFEHGDFVGRIKAAHYLRNARGYTLGENIAWGSWDYATPANIVDGWMHSPGHKANILNSRFHEIGLGVARGAPTTGQDRAGTYVTDFGTIL